MCNKNASSNVSWEFRKGICLDWVRQVEVEIEIRGREKERERGCVHELAFNRSLECFRDRVGSCTSLVQ